MVNTHPKQLAPWVNPDTVAKVPVVGPHVQVVAKGGGLVPGAIVCGTLNDVSMMFDLYSNSVSEQLADRLTGGQSQLMRGRAASLPDFKAFGCELVPAGTPMIMLTGSTIPLVQAKLPSGKLVQGVTTPGLISQR